MGLVLLNQSHARLWVHLSREARRRKALQALADRDAKILLSLVEAFVTIFSQEMKASSRAGYRRGIELLIEHSNCNLIRMRPEEAALYIRRLEWLEYRPDKRYAPASLSIYLNAGRVLYDALIWADAHRSDRVDRPLLNPFANVKLSVAPTPPEEAFGVYTDVDISRLLETADPELKTLILLGAHGGLRITEILNLKYKHVDLDNHVLQVVAGKGSKRRRVLLTRTLEETLASASLPLSYTSRQNAYHVMKRHCIETGVVFKEKGVHGLRHYAGTKVLQATGDLLKAKRHLGHSSIMTTERYAKQVTGGFNDNYVDEFREIFANPSVGTSAPRRIKI